MAIWTKDDWGRPDFQLIQNGFVIKFHSPTVLRKTIATLAELDYDVVRIAASNWRIAADAHSGLAGAMSFPDYYGGNLDALGDCLDDIAVGDYGWDADRSGLAIVLDGIDGFWRASPDTASAIFDVFSRTAVRAALHGIRMMFLIRTDDPSWEPGEFGAQTPPWNPDEWGGRTL